jgi:hypothetical protein
VSSRGARIIFFDSAVNSACVSVTSTMAPV